MPPALPDLLLTWRANTVALYRYTPEGDGMEQQLAWLEAAINAAGVSTVYNAEDWDRFIQSQAGIKPTAPTPFPPYL